MTNSSESVKCVVNFHASEQPQLQPKDAAISMKCPIRETLGSSARRRPLEPQLLQMNTSFSVGMEPLWQPKKAAFSVGQKQQTREKKLVEGSSQVDRGTRSMVHESSQDFSRMLHEQLQEFAMILTKKYHYNFPAEFFEDYHGNFNKEEFLGIKCSNGKSRRQEAGEPAMKEEENVMKIADFQPCDSIFSNSNNYGGCKDSACSNNRRSEGLAPSAWIKEESKEYSNPFGKKVVDEDDSDDNSGSPKQEMLEAFDQLSRMAGDTKESLESGSDSAAVMEELTAGRGVVAAPNSEAHNQALPRYLRQVSNLPLLQIQEIAGNFTIKHGGELDGTAINAARDTCLTFLLVRDGDGLPKEAKGTLHSSFKLQVPTTNHIRPGVADHVFQWKAEINWTALARGGCMGLESPNSSSTPSFELEIIEANRVVFIAALSQIVFGLGLGILRTKKKKPRRIKREKDVEQKLKVGIG